MCGLSAQLSDAPPTSREGPVERMNTASSTDAANQGGRKESCLIGRSDWILISGSRDDWKVTSLLVPLVAASPSQARCQTCVSLIKSAGRKCRQEIFVENIEHGDSGVSWGSLGFGVFVNSTRLSVARSRTQRNKRATEDKEGGFVCASSCRAKFKASLNQIIRMKTPLCRA